MYHDKNATIMVEFINIDYVRQAHHEISVTYPDLAIDLIDDLRQVLNRSRSPAQHTQRKKDLPSQTFTSNLSDPNSQEPHLELAYTYKLRHVFSSLSHVQI